MTHHCIMTWFLGVWENGSMLLGTPKYVAQSATDAVLVAALCEREL